LVSSTFPKVLVRAVEVDRVTVEAEVVEKLGKGVVETLKEKGKLRFEEPSKVSRVSSALRFPFESQLT